MTAETIAKALGGRKVGCCWMVRCPAHDDRDPSLSITTGKDGKVLFCCHAGCNQSRVIDALRARGLWRLRSRHSGRPQASKARQPDISATERVETKRTESALRIWRSSVPVPGTLAEAYLQSRELHVSLPQTLRFHARLRHPSGGLWPAMLALVTRGMDDVPLAIHRTFLAHDGSRKAPVKPQKMLLGPCRGGAVRLAPLGGTLMVGEGIETCLAAMQAASSPAWAALSTSGLRSLELPVEVSEVIILADGDDAGDAVARYAAVRWTSEGRCVRVARPPRGHDFNDVLCGRKV